VNSLLDETEWSHAQYLFLDDDNFFHTSHVMRVMRMLNVYWELVALYNLQGKCMLC
jgi:hypothetical protein